MLIRSPKSRHSALPAIANQKTVETRDYSLKLSAMLQRTLPAGFIAPCLPTKIDTLPSGGQRLHEIKHDGFRIIARKNGSRVQLYSRPGNDLTSARQPTEVTIGEMACLYVRPIISHSTLTCLQSIPTRVPLERDMPADAGGVFARW